MSPVGWPGANHRLARQNRGMANDDDDDDDEEENAPRLGERPAGRRRRRHSREGLEGEEHLLNEEEDHDDGEDDDDDEEEEDDDDDHRPTLSGGPRRGPSSSLGRTRRRRALPPGEAHRPPETVEAALNRLDRHYHVALTCIAAWIKADQTLATPKSTTPHPSSGRDDPTVSAATTRPEETRAAAGEPATTTTDPTLTRTSHHAKLDTIRHVGQSARRILEEALLLDPLIAHSYAPNLVAFLLSSTPSRRRRRGTLPVSTVQLSSAGHHAKVRQLAYLSLINYADVLLAGLGSHQHQPTTKSEARETRPPSILDQGVVPPIQSLPSSSFPSCWQAGVAPANDNDHNVVVVEEEEEEEMYHDDEPVATTVRLAVWSYLDAVALDGSDPVLWVKLACAARRLGRCGGDHDDSNDDRSQPRAVDDLLVADSSSRPGPWGRGRRYRRLELYALEKAILAVPEHQPPNRTAVRAWQQWQEEQERWWSTPSTDADVEEAPFTLPSPCVDIHVPRASWSTLGRILCRVCKDGPWFVPHSRLKSAHSMGGVVVGPRFAVTPNVKLIISPFLLLPFPVLVKICQHLGRSQTWRLEATCRAMSASVVSVRALLDQRSISPHASPALTEKGKLRQGTERDHSTGMATSKQDDENSGKGDVPPDRQEGARAQTSRASKRLRSQLITEGKRAERSYNRSSIRYCLMAATLGCTSQDRAYQKCLLDAPPWESPLVQSNRTPKSPVSPVDKLAKPSDVPSQVSLATFLAQWSQDSTPPLRILFAFVACCALHASETFATDPGGAIALGSCLVDCYQLLCRQTKLNAELLPAWSLAPHCIPQDVRLDSVECFAMDILHLELRLRRCGDDEDLDVDFDGDANFVSMLAPRLVERMREMDSKKSGASKVWTKLKVRCLWSAACVDLWKSKISRDVGLSRDCELEGIRLLEEAIECLRRSDGEELLRVPTPYLDSIGRNGAHWKEISVQTLSAYRDEIQASSVLLLANEKFSKVKSTLTAENEAHLLDEPVRDTLFEIGRALHGRYAPTINTDDSCKSNLVEIINDFMIIHGDKLVNDSMGKSPSVHDLEEWFDELVPFQRVDTISAVLRVSNPCIISLLVTCLQTKDEGLSVVIGLLARLVIAVAEVTIKMQRKVASFDGDITELEDDSVSSIMDDANTIPKQNADNATREKICQHGRFACLLLRKLRATIGSASDRKTTDTFAGAGEFGSLIQMSMSLLTYLVRPDLNVWVTDNADSELFVSIVSVVDCMATNLSTDSMNEPTRHFFRGMINVIVHRQSVLKNLQEGRERCDPSERDAAIRGLGSLLATVCCEFGQFLSRHTVEVSGMAIVQSYIFEHPGEGSLPVYLCHIVSSLVWLWENFTALDAQEAFHGNTGVQKIDNWFQNRVKLPVAMAIVGLCGAAARFAPTKDALSTQVGLTEFYDSDESAMDWVDATNTDAMLRVLLQVVHCITRIFGAFDEVELVHFEGVETYQTQNGPALPLTVVRILNHLARILLVEFRSTETDEDEALWGEYNYGTRSIGQLMDASLQRAYKCLHGFTLAASNDTKDPSPAQGGHALPNRASFLPENAKAAADLFRCILRTYSQGRRSPPKAALDAVVSALPENEPSNASSALHSYLFEANEEGFELKELLSLLRKSSNFEDQFNKMQIQEWTVERTSDESEDECFKVRRGIASLLSQGPVPQYQEIADMDERASSTHVEEEISRKFFAILEDISFSFSLDSEKWCKAAECLIVKSDLIADRLGLSSGFSRSPNFMVTERPGIMERSLQIAKLLADQEREAVLRDEGWVQSLGNDLSIFVKFSWSSVDSLKKCAAAVGRSYKDQDPNEHRDEGGFKARVFEEIDHFLKNEDAATWQQAWGGLFVTSIRKIAHRCLRLALFVAGKFGATPDSPLLESELCESLGLLMYSNLLGSQMYGYPMQPLPVHRKRKIAEAALACYEHSIATSKPQYEADIKDEYSTWDLHFMTGKCLEKIAYTFHREKFMDSTVAGGELSDSKRRFESSMMRALEAYWSSYEFAKHLEREGRLISDQQGGSAHGSVEVLYRLHASRLKCLIAAVNFCEDERELAEREALRLAESFWYAKPTEESQGNDLRDRIWLVLADIVAALAACRNENPFFHRSVYRHAQALMWAPVLCDPINGWRLGSLGEVPATRACQLRGLNFSTHAAHSALAAMQVLFDRKRNQLCAVWVTAGSNSALQVLNNHVRKYDSLRGKYIGAYIECLRLCRRWNELEVLLRWASSSKRDLPSYFIASLKGLPAHTNDTLMVKGRSLASYHFLTTIKRQANSALAYVILQEIKSRKSTDPKVAENHLKSAYACLLRLNCCDASELTKSRLWRYKQNEHAKVVVETICTAYAKVATDEEASLQSGLQADWSGAGQVASLLEAALRRCRELFPNLTSTFFSKRKPLASGSGGGVKGGGGKKKSVPPPAEAGATSRKRSYEVTVPEGLQAGDSFVAAIDMEGQTKKVRMTVPPGAGATLRFTVQLSTPEVGPPPA